MELGSVTAVRPKGRMGPQLDQEFLDSMKKLGKSGFVKIHTESDEIALEASGIADVTQGKIGGEPIKRQIPPTADSRDLDLRDYLKQTAPEPQEEDQIRVDQTGMSPYASDDEPAVEGPEEEAVLKGGVPVVGNEEAKHFDIPATLIDKLRSRGITADYFSERKTISIPEGVALSKAKIKEEMLTCCLELLDTRLEIRTSQPANGNWDNILSLLEKGYQLTNPATMKSMIIKLSDSPNLARYRSEPIGFPCPTDINHAVLMLVKTTDLKYEVEYKLGL